MTRKWSDIRREKGAPPMFSPGVCASLGDAELAWRERQHPRNRLGALICRFAGHRWTRRTSFDIYWYRCLRCAAFAGGDLEIGAGGLR